jgi:hypothetical protein
MSLRGVIQRPDKAPLGSSSEVKRQLSKAFPGVNFTYQAEEPPGVARVRKNMSLFLRLWLSVFGVDRRYPHHHGHFMQEQGGAVEFYFEADEPVRWISTTMYGRTMGLAGNFDHLFAATGWIVKYPRF